MRTGDQGRTERVGHVPDHSLINRGQYSDAVLDELESQNDAQVEGMTAKVRMLKDVSSPSPPLNTYTFPIISTTMPITLPAKNTSSIDNNSNRRRNPHFLGPRGQNERYLR
jgi:hypothetical protein